MLTLKAELINITYSDKKIELNLFTEQYITPHVSCGETIKIEIPKSKLHLYKNKINEIVSVDIKIDCKLIYTSI